MTIFGGYYRLSAVPSGDDASLRKEIRQLLVRSGAESCQEWSQGRLFAAWFDGGAYPDRGQWSGPASFCIVAGDPIYTPSPKSRTEQVAALAAAGERITRELAHCVGQFSLLFHDAQNDRLILATDALGVRPLYYARHGELLYFATSLFLLEGLSGLPLTVSAEGLFQRISLGYNLDGKTPYREVRVLRQGEYLKASPEGWGTGFYWRWDQIPPTELDYPQRVRTTFELFRQAVERRCWRSQDSIAMLSGGLDSRMVVGVLNQLGKRIVTINFTSSRAALLDELYAERVAAALGCEHICIPSPPGPDLGELVKEGIRRVPRPLDPAATRLVFSGDGGSVGLGLVYYEPQTIGLLRSGDIKGALELFLSKHSTLIPERYVQRQVTARAEERLREVACALMLAEKAEPGRLLHLFLIQNDQRAHLHPYFEKIVVLGHEVLTPFFDAELLRFVLACPVDDFLRHKLYHDLLRYLPESISRIPWQTYPGHLPCPVEDATQGVSQFSKEGQRALSSRFRTLPLRVLKLAVSGRFPSPPFRRLPVLAVAVAGALGWRRFDYVHHAVMTAGPFLQVAQGRLCWDLEPRRDS